MALSLTIQDSVNDATSTASKSDKILGTYKCVELGPEYEFVYNKYTKTYTIKPAEYKMFTTADLDMLDFGDAEIFSCEFKLGETVENYQPDGGLKFWKIQRKVYRLIGDYERVVETTMYPDGDIVYSKDKFSNLTHTMVIPGPEETYLHFELLFANGRMSEILNQCEANNIYCNMAMRLKTGQCIYIKTR